MKQKTDLIVNSAGCFFVGPILGVMTAGIVVGILKAVMWTIAGISGFIASIFFDVDFTAIESRMPVIRQLVPCNIITFV